MSDRADLKEDIRKIKEDEASWRVKLSDRLEAADVYRTEAGGQANYVGILEAQGRNPASTTLLPAYIKSVGDLAERGVSSCTVSQVLGRSYNPYGAFVGKSRKICSTQLE